MFFGLSRFSAPLNRMTFMTSFFQENSQDNKQWKTTLLRSVAALPIAAALMLGACSSTTKPPSTAKAVTHQDALAGVQYWGKRYRKDSNDRAASLNYASALRRTGQTTQAVAVLRQASTIHTDDPGVQAAYGKALAAEGQLDTALRVIQSAQRPDLPDWRLVSAEGAILDQTGIHDGARERYHYALQLSPAQPSVLSNLGMSHVLTGDLAEAEKLLRHAMEQPNVDGRVRQNLSLVVGLQGRFEEAEQIARSDLPPEQASANIAYLRELLAQENTWDKLKKTESPS